MQTVYLYYIGDAMKAVYLYDIGNAMQAVHLYDICDAMQTVYLYDIGDALEPKRRPAQWNPQITTPNNEPLFAPPVVSRT